VCEEQFLGGAVGEESGGVGGLVGKDGGAEGWMVGDHLWMTLPRPQ
jgi:hypothetical protein